MRRCSSYCFNLDNAINSGWNNLLHVGDSCELVHLYKERAKEWASVISVAWNKCSLKWNLKSMPLYSFPQQFAWRESDLVVASDQLGSLSTICFPRAAKMPSLTPLAVSVAGEKRGNTNQMCTFSLVAASATCYACAHTSAAEDKWSKQTLPGVSLIFLEQFSDEAEFART